MFNYVDKGSNTGNTCFIKEVCKNNRINAKGNGEIAKLSFFASKSGMMTKLLDYRKNNLINSKNIAQ